MRYPVKMGFLILVRGLIDLSVLSTISNIAGVEKLEEMAVGTEIYAKVDVYIDRIVTPKERKKVEQVKFLILKHLFGPGTILDGAEDVLVTPHKLELIADDILGLE